MNRATSETTIQLQDHYFTSAERVISAIRRSLCDRGVNVDVLEEIHKAQLSSASTSHVPDEQDATTSAQSVLLDSVPMEIELNNVDVDIEPGVYDVDCDGVLQTSSTPTPISTISDNINNDHTCGHEELSPVHTENTGNGCADLAITGTGILTSVASVEENSTRSEERSASHVETHVCDKENSQHSQVVKNTSSHFENHLFWPGLLSSTRKQRSAKERPPSAISSAAWREFYSKKDLAKSKEEELKAHRKQERENRKSQKVLKKKSGKGKDKRKNSRFSSDESGADLMTQENYVRQQCAVCNYELSDVEDDALKIIGCDSCSKWFHLKCTELRSLPYDLAARRDFNCHFC